MVNNCIESISKSCYCIVSYMVSPRHLLFICHKLVLLDHIYDVFVIEYIKDIKYNNVSMSKKY